MMAVGLEAGLRWDSHATNTRGTAALDTGWEGTTLGATVSRRPTGSVGTGLRAMALGMLESLDPGSLSAATRHYEYLVDDILGTGSGVVRETERPVRAADVAVLIPDRVIAEIRSTLSLNISETARALGVERPTVYAWLAGQATPQRTNLIRLARIADVAASWRRRTSRPLGDIVRLPGMDGTSIAELLADDTLRDRDIQDRLDYVASLPGGEASSRRVASVREAASHHGLAARDPKDGAAEIDWLTRPSFGDEDD